MQQLAELPDALIALVSYWLPIPRTRHLEVLWVHTEAFCSTFDIRAEQYRTANQTHHIGLMP